MEEGLWAFSDIRLLPGEPDQMRCRLFVHFHIF